MEVSCNVICNGKDRKVSIFGRIVWRLLVPVKTIV